ncbi:flocculation protein FLO11, partial [Biomphalaria glabrata]
TSNAVVHHGENSWNVVPDRFLPPPTILSYNPEINIEKSSESKLRYTHLFQSLHLSQKAIFYDQFCPSLSGQLHNKMCECGLYLALLTLLNNHTKVHIPPSNKTRAQKVHIPPSNKTRAQKVHIPPSNKTRAQKVHIPPSNNTRAQKVHIPPSNKTRAQKVHIPASNKTRAQKVHIPPSNKTRAQKAKRIIKKKDNKVLVVLGNAGEESVEWRDEDILIFESAPQAEEENLPVYTIDEHMKPLWEKTDKQFEINIFFYFVT